MLALLAGSALVMLLMFERSKNDSTTVDTSGFDLSTAAANEDPREGSTSSGHPESHVPDQTQGASGLGMSPRRDEGMKFGGGMAAPPVLPDDSGGSDNIDSGKIMNKVMNSNPDIQKAAGRSNEASTVR